jgi:hypothetical protein
MAKDPNQSSFEAILGGIYKSGKAFVPEGDEQQSTMLLGFAESDENEQEISYLLGKRVKVTVERIDE